MKSKMMTLNGHYASPLCKYSECRTPVEWELWSAFKSIDELLSEAVNCELAGQKYTSTYDSNPFDYKYNHFYADEYKLYRGIARTDRPMALGKEFYVMTIMTHIGEPVLGVHVSSDDEKLLDELLEQVKDCTSSQNKWFDYDIMDIEKNSLKDQAIKQIRQKCRSTGRLWH